MVESEWRELVASAAVELTLKLHPETKNNNINLCKGSVSQQLYPFTVTLQTLIKQRNSKDVYDLKSMAVLKTGFDLQHFYQFNSVLNKTESSSNIKLKMPL